MQQHKFRAHCLAEIMTDPKGKDEVLSVGAKTAVLKMAKELVYGYDERISSRTCDRQIPKGLFQSFCLLLLFVFNSKFRIDACPPEFMDHPV